MNGNEFLDRMEWIDPAYVEAADMPPRIQKRSRFRPWFVAACLCILAGAMTALAAGSFGTQLIEFFTSRTAPGSDYSESGYVLGAQVKKFSDDALKGKIREVPALIRRQFASYELYMSQSPGYWQKSFATRDDAYDYIGFDGLKHLQWDPEEKQTTLYVQGAENGDMLSVSVETLYTVGDIRLQFFATIYTAHTDGEITVSTATTENVRFEEAFRTTKNGKTLHVITQTASESGYLVENGVLYHLHIAYPEDASGAAELLEQWADLF
mgnify:CR=1 FL=1